MQAILSRYSRFLIFPALLLAGALFSYRLVHVPSRMEATCVIIGAFLIPTLKYPKFGVYYLFCTPFFIPLFRRMYYLISDRPALDYLMLISDGVMCGFIVALVLLWILNKERSRDGMTILIIAYVILLFLKIFMGNIGSTVEGFYGFKFNGLYVMFFFAGSYILLTAGETRRLLGFVSWIMLVTAAYGIKQIIFGFSSFEQKWIDSIVFTTLKIEGVVRPFSTYASPAAMSDGMTILFMAGVYWIVARGRHMTLFGVMLTGASVAPLLIATVRTNWLAVVAGLFFYLVFLRIRKLWIKIAITLFMAAGLVVFASKGGDAASQDQNTALTAQLTRKDKSLSEIMITSRTHALANPLQEYSVQRRMQTWEEIIYFSLRYPLGRGQGSTGYAHSYYFQVLGEIGFPGLIIFLFILILCFQRGLRVIGKSDDPETVELTRFLLTVIFMISILNVTGTHLHTSPGDIFFWFGAGAISRFYRRLPSEKSPDAAAETAAAVAGPAEAHG
jgi:hypothetical protein